jgi:hypothetical protein
MTNDFKTFAVFVNGGVILHKNFTLHPDRYIQVNENEPVPIEDYGDWMLFHDDVNEEEAFEKFLNQL